MWGDLVDWFDTITAGCMTRELDGTYDQSRARLDGYLHWTGIMGDSL